MKAIPTVEADAGTVIVLETSAPLEKVITVVTPSTVNSTVAPFQPSP